jgi:glutathione S-transferase
VILDGETLIESGPIVSRLIETYSSPSNAHVEAPASAKSQFWSHFSEASFMNILAAGRVVEIGAAGLAPSMSPQEAAGAQKLVKWHKAYVRGGVTQVLGLVEKFLKQNENFSGSEKLGEGDVSIHVCWCAGVLVCSRVTWVDRHT